MIDPETVLARFTYRSGWRFSISRVTQQPALLVRVAVPDSRNPRSPTQIGMAFPIMPLWLGDEERFLRLVWDCIRQLEDHERLEWMKLDGSEIWPAHVGDESRFSPGPQPTADVI